MNPNEIAKEISVTCGKMLEMLHSNNIHRGDIGLGELLKLSDYLSTTSDKDKAREYVSTFRTLYRGRAFLADGGLPDSGYVELQRRLDNLSGELEKAYNLSRVIGEYTIDKDGKVKYK